MGQRWLTLVSLRCSFWVGPLVPTDRWTMETWQLLVVCSLPCRGTLAEQSQWHILTAAAREDLYHAQGDLLSP